MNDRGASKPPSGIVARGKIKVDARKAIRKLRDHLLVDLHLYACEIARVAVAMGATKLDVTWDSDDVVLTFDGRPLPAQAIVRARDHVLTPEADAIDGDALRVLGIGVSAALGLDPRFVDVTTADASGCTQVRFESKHIAEEGAGDVPESAAVALPKDMPCPGMRVHVRKKVRLGDLGRMARGDPPREVVLLAHATRDAPLVVTIEGATVPRVPGATVLLRVDLDEPSITRGALEIVWPVPGHTPRTLFLDLGVHLAQTGSIGLREGIASELPIRIVLDARKLPTNASRSEVRMDSELVSRVRARMPSALAAALATLQAMVIGGEAAPLAIATKGLKLGHSVEVLDPRREVLEEALGAMAADVALMMRAGGTVTAEEQALLQLPLLRDAVGRPMSLASLRGGTAEQPLLVYTANAPAPAELASWLTGVVWRRGRAVERAFASLAQTSANDRVAQARDGWIRRARALEHPPSFPVLATSESYVLKEAFAVTEGPFAGLAGEVAIVRREGGYRRASTARLFVDDRLLEELPLPGVALPVDMALSWPSGLRARLAYDGVEREDGSVTRAVLYALRVAALAVGERLGPKDPELTRLAIVAFASAARDLGDTSPRAKALGKLAYAAVWPTTDGNLTSLAVLDSYANHTGALCVAPPGARRPLDDRPVVVAEHGKTLLGLLREQTVLVDYRALGRSEAEILEAIELHAREAHPRVPIEREHVIGFVGVGPNRMRILHGGRVMRDMPHAFRNGPVLIVLEDRAAVPGSPAHDGLLWTSTGEIYTGREEDALLELVVDGCERGELDHARYADYLATAQRKVADRLTTGGKTARREEMVALGNRLTELPARIAREKLVRAKEAILARPLHASRTPAAATGSPFTASVTTRSGVVTVSMLRGADSPPAAEVLFEGHPVGTTSLVSFPVGAVIDVVRESLIHEWEVLSADGLTWARDGAIEATLKLLGDLARRDDFTSDLDALRLCQRLVSHGAQVAARVALVLRTARWPTVQGGLSTLGAATSVNIGRVAYAPYRTAKDVKEASPYDVLALCIPSGPLGDHRRRALEGAGYSLTDVTEEIARLQNLRLRGAASPPPRLPGKPVHEDLRASLSELGATLAEGELEIPEEAMVSLARVDDAGAAQPFSLPLAQPVRAVFRAGEVTREALAADLAAATARHLRSLAPSVDDLPAFVRERVRMLVLDAVRRGERRPIDDAANVFLDVRGYHWSLARLLEVGAVRRTRDPGPWASALDGHEAAALLHLGDADAGALASVLRIEDVTNELRERWVGETRRAAPPAASMTLPPEIRAKCIFIVQLAEEGIRGEVGLLRPAHAEIRAIAVYTTMRLVRVIEDRDGWPTIAMVDVDNVETTRAFDGLASRGDLARIQRSVRLAASSRAAVLLEAPRDVLGVVRLPIPFLARPSGTAPGSSALATPCLGVFWLEKTWPEAPAVHVEMMDGVDPFRVPRVPVTAGAHHGLLPISGRAFVCAAERQAQPALEAMFRSVLERIAPIVAAATGANRAPPEELAAYAWDLRLLGVRADEDPVKELAKDRPRESLMRVAARRAPGLIDQATGDATRAKADANARARAKAEAKAEADAYAEANANANADEKAGADAIAYAIRDTIATAHAQVDAGRAPVDLAPVAGLYEDADAGAEEGFFHGLVRKMVELVTPATAPVVAPSELCDALLRGLLAMKLTGDPVAEVVEARRGRPVRYEARTQRVVINVAHAALKALEGHPSRVLFLLSAAVSEINRELVPVTDAEELKVIVDLLRDG